MTDNKEKTAYYRDRLNQGELKQYLIYNYPVSYINIAEVNLYLKDYPAVLKILKTLIKELKVDKFTLAVV